VDWSIGEGEVGEPGVAAVKTREGAGVSVERSAERVVTTGCGQGSVFGDLMAHIDEIELPPAQITQGQLYGIVNAIRLQESTYKSSGSVHGCALFQGEEMLLFVEDVGRHNAVDTIAGWMWMNDIGGSDKVFYTTGRLTSEMVIKSAQMGITVVVSRSGITQMGLDVAERVGLCAIGRATNKRFLCFSAPHRLLWQPSLAEPATASPG
jgi:FdhD protein